MHRVQPIRACSRALARKRHACLRWLGYPFVGAACILASLAATHPARADDDRAATDAIMRSSTPVEASVVTAGALEGANQAVERATRMRAAGDEAHAKLADGLAREWAETARDLGLAVAAEKLADDRKLQAIQAQAQLERTKALVEEGIARLGRLRAELDSVTPSKPAATATSAPSRPASAQAVSAPGSPPAPSGASSAPPLPAPTSAPQLEGAPASSGGTP